MTRFISLGFVLALFTACHSNKGAEGPAERAGKGIDTAAEKTKAGLQKAAEKTDEAAHVAVHATGEAFERAGAKLKGTSGATPAPAAKPTASSDSKKPD